MQELSITDGFMLGLGLFFAGMAIAVTASVFVWVVGVIFCKLLGGNGK
jgi:hypothetical protein